MCNQVTLYLEARKSQASTCKDVVPIIIFVHIVGIFASRYLLIVCCVVNFREEWEWLRRLSTNEVNAPPTPTQTAFHNSLVSACKKLLDNLGRELNTPSRVYNVRFYSISSLLANI